MNILQKLLKIQVSEQAEHRNFYYVGLKSPFRKWMINIDSFL